MKIKAIKAFTPYAINPAFYEWCGKAAKSARTAEVIEHFIAKDPGATDWSSVGLVEPVDEGKFVHDLDGTARLLMMQFNDRILPGAVRDETLSVRFKELTEKQGRALNKKEFAQLREDVEYELLPKAFIRRSLVPVMVFPNRILICTSSASKSEKIAVHLGRLCAVRNVQYDFTAIDTIGSVESLLARLSRDGVDHSCEDVDMTLYAASSVVFKGEDKRTVRVKDRSVMSADVQQFVNGAYAVTELGMSVQNDAEDSEVAAFTLTDKFIFKGIKLSDITVSGIGSDASDLHATFWLHAQTFATILNVVVTALNEGQADADQSADTSEEL